MRGSSKIIPESELDFHFRPLSMFSSFFYDYRVMVRIIQRYTGSATFIKVKYASHVQIAPESVVFIFNLKSLGKGWISLFCSSYGLNNCDLEPMEATSLVEVVI